MSRIPSRAFLEITTDQGDWKLPRKIYREIQKHIGSIPTFVLLPWPVNLLVPEGHEINLDGLAGFYEVVVNEVSYHYLKSVGVTAYMTASPTEEVTRKHDMHTLLTLAEEGFLFEDRTPILDVLKSAGFPLKHEDYKN